MIASKAKQSDDYSTMLQNIVDVLKILVIMVGMVKIHFDLATKVEVNTIKIEELTKKSNNTHALLEKVGAEVGTILKEVKSKK